MIHFEPSDRWFALSFDGDDVLPAIEVLIFDPIVDQFSKHLKKMKDAQAQDLMQMFRFQTYEWNVRKGFGFDGALQGAGKRGKYTALRADISSGQATNAIAASLSMLLRALSVLPHICKFKMQHDTQRRQLMLVDASLRKQQLSSAPVGGYLAPEVVHWMRDAASIMRHVRPVERAMWQTRNKLALMPYPVERDGPHLYPHCEARIERDGRFSFDCPAANGIFTHETWPGGYAHQQIGCSNMDGPVRQIVMFAALAALHDLVADYVD